MRRYAWIIAGMLAAAGSATAANVVNIGLIPSEDPNIVISDNKPFLDALGRSLQMEVKPFVATDYNGVIEALRSKKLDAAFVGLFSYVLAVSIADVEAFAIPETARQSTTYRAYIIARKDRGIHKLADLKGRTFAFC
jgi:phosphonate transport system substrate-binding protein